MIRSRLASLLLDLATQVEPASAFVVDTLARLAHRIDPPCEWCGACGLECECVVSPKAQGHTTGRYTPDVQRAVATALRPCGTTAGGTRFHAPECDGFACTPKESSR